MITTFQLESMLYKHLNGGPLSQAISGVVYKRQRPKNSNLEDVGINVVYVNNSDLSRALGSVNIHAPNLSIDNDNDQPDLQRLEELAELAIAELTDRWKPELKVLFDIQQQLLIKEPEVPQHYINIRIDFYSINV